MALIECSDCGTHISDKADKCIKCGRPQRAASSNSSVRTIEATGKDAKIVSLIGAFLTIAGLVMIFTSVSPGVGGVAFIAGLITLIAGRIMAWWKYR